MIKNYYSFENDVINQFKNKDAIIFTNIYWIKDVDSKYVFQGVTKVRLEDTYNGIISYYRQMDPQLAESLYKSSILAFNHFKKTGKLVDYNKIPLNLPKFVLTEWLSEFID